MKRFAGVLAVIAALGGVGLIPASLGQPPGGKLAGFMRPKLEHSQGVLEGLALENFDLVAKNAKALKERSEAAEWKVSPNLTYLRYSGEFQRLADELVEQAKDKNIDGATLAYVQLTLNCVNCHKYVRRNRLITALPAGARAESRVR